jgi:GAF domain-containing protein
MTTPTHGGGRTDMPRPAEPNTRERQLADVFVTLADTLVADYDVVEVLDLLVGACVETLGATAAGLLLSDQRGHLAVMASSAEDSRVLEVFQVQNDEGPCLDCFQQGKPVTVPDLAAAADRWPRFAPVAIERGFRSVHALPMRLRDNTIGALNLFHGEDTPLSDDELRIAQALADTATIGILQQRALQASHTLAEQLQTALNSRVVIEQAKGVLAASGDVDMDEAFQALRRHARNNNLQLTEAARQIATHVTDPAEVLQRDEQP